MGNFSTSRRKTAAGLGEKVGAFGFKKIVAIGKGDPVSHAKRRKKG